MYENHSQDTRYTGPLDVAPTVNATYGMGGNNQPFVTEEEAVPITMKIRCGGGNGGKGQLCQRDKSATLACNNDQTLFVPEKESCYWDGGQTAGTLTNRNAGGAQRMPDKDNFNCVLESGKPSDREEPAQQAFGISSFQSHAMLSDNPHAGIYEAETSRTLDCNGGSPVQNQGGISIVEQESMAFTQNQRDEVRNLGDKSASLQAQPGMKQQTYVLQGNMIGRDDKNGPQGSGVSKDVCYTLTDVDRHAVAAPDPVYAMTTGGFTQVEKEMSPTLMARDYKDPTTVAPVKEAEPHYTVRRLTPTECARLQGFYDWWTEGLGNPNPTDEEVAFWMDVWETHRKVVSHASKPKTERQVRKWLADPYSESAAYKLWGNGVALPCVYFIMRGITWAAGKE